MAMLCHVAGVKVHQQQAAIHLQYSPPTAGLHHSYRNAGCIASGRDNVHQERPSGYPQWIVPCGMHDAPTLQLSKPYCGTSSQGSYYVMRA